MRIPGPRFVLLVAAAYSLCACATLPGLVFEPEEAGVDGSIVTIDSGAGGPRDAAPADVATLLDARLDHAVPPAPDAARDADLPPNTCPGAVPPGATLCCQSIPCVGADKKKCNAACPNCEGACNVGQTCCLGSGGVFAGCSSIACP